MNRLEGISAKTAIVFLGAFIVVGGFALALLSSNVFGTNGVFGPSYSGANSNLAASPASGQIYASNISGIPNVYPGGTQVIKTVTSLSTTSNVPGTTVVRGAGAAPGPTTYLQNNSIGTGAQIEFSSSVTIEVATAQQTASGVVALAYSVGGYVAYQSTYKDSAYVVIRVPAASYQAVLAKVEAMGNVISLVSNSNDVHVQYTDLNATLASLRTEQGALLRLLNQSTTINSTLAIETQLQGVDQQINNVQSQILQTKTLIDFATIEVTISKAVQKAPLSMTLTTTPTNGTAPLSVTFNAIVKGGAQPYVINYNFGDGSADQGQILIHTYYSSGDFKVTVTATDQNGTVASARANVRVTAPPNQYGVTDFPTMIANLFVSVVEGIVEVAVVVLPLAAVGAVLVIPLRRRSRAQKDIKQS